LEELSPLHGRRISQAKNKTEVGYKLLLGFLSHGIPYDPEDGVYRFL
jgi:hypothetical protein